MIIKTDEELQAMLEIGRICAITLKKMSEALEPGITTKELDMIGAEVMHAYGAQSAPMRCYNFPGFNCISVNHIVAHGIPDDYVVKPGDIVNIDVSAVKDGFYGDNSGSFAVPPIKSTVQKLLDCGKRTLECAINAIVAGEKLNLIGRAAEKEAHRHGYKIITNLCGHGVGHTLHDDPEAIYNYYEKGDHRIIQPGQVMAIEPFVSARDSYVVETNQDGWSLATPHRCQVVQFEHTVMAREGEPPLILTLPE